MHLETIVLYDVGLVSLRVFPLFLLGSQVMRHDVPPVLLLVGCLLVHVRARVELRLGVSLLNLHLLLPVSLDMLVYPVSYVGLPQVPLIVVLAPLQLQLGILGLVVLHLAHQVIVVSCPSIEHLLGLHFSKSLVLLSPRLLCL